MTAGYSGTPLPQKLGIKPDGRVLLVAAPADFQLEQLPGGVSVARRAAGQPFDVIVLFCLRRNVLVARFEPLVPKLTAAGGLWACWPKKASGVSTDLTEQAVREHGLGAGLVDVKIAAIDATWSGLKFVRRLADR